jgi:hypothetical protein
MKEREKKDAETKSIRSKLMKMRVITGLILFFDHGLPFVIRQ